MGAQQQQMNSTRPQPPVELREPGEQFVAAFDLLDWIAQTFIEDGASLANADHQHLQQAQIGVLWTNIPNARQMRQVLATAEMPMLRGNAWQKGRQQAQIVGWFGGLPDFLLTFYAPEAATMDDATWCALVEHELYHCAQALDEFGAPKFRRDGTPAFAIRGHDVEEFLGVVRRYGAGPASDGVAQMVEAAKMIPAVRRSDIGRACGTCQLRLA